MADAGKIKQNKRLVKTHLKNLQKLQNDLFAISETDVKLASISEEGDPWETLNANFDKMCPFFEETINRWSQRSAQKKPVDIMLQVKQSVNPKQIAKTQMLKSTILGHNPSNTNIYNDHDLYTVMLSDYLAMNDDSQQQNASGDYLYGADLSLTQKYLAKKQKLKEIEISRKKQIDRKATKGRKIRYVVHDKIQSFMAPSENMALMEGKDHIINNLFGQTKTVEAPKKKHRKNSDNVKLI